MLLPAIKKSSPQRRSNWPPGGVYNHGTRRQRPQEMPMKNRWSSAAIMSVCALACSSSKSTSDASLPANDAALPPGSGGTSVPSGTGGAAGQTTIPAGSGGTSVPAGTGGAAGQTTIPAGSGGKGGAPATGGTAGRTTTAGSGGKGGSAGTGGTAGRTTTLPGSGGGGINPAPGGAEGQTSTPIDGGSADLVNPPPGSAFFIGANFWRIDWEPSEDFFVA